MKNLIWSWQVGTQLSVSELYHILQLRVEVFVVEQECPYQDVDGLDLDCWHLSLFTERSPQKPAAYLRVFPPKNDVITIGRVIVASDYRKQGLGRVLMQEAHLRCQSFEFKTIQLSAQHHLENFYKTLGYSPVGVPYDEDGIPHIKMTANHNTLSFPPS